MRPDSVRCVESGSITEPLTSRISMPNIQTPYESPALLTPDRHREHSPRLLGEHFLLRTRPPESVRRHPPDVRGSRSKADSSLSRQPQRIPRRHQKPGPLHASGTAVPFVIPASLSQCHVGSWIKAIPGHSPGVGHGIEYYLASN